MLGPNAVMAKHLQTTVTTPNSRTLSVKPLSKPQSNTMVSMHDGLDDSSHPVSEAADVMTHPIERGGQQAPEQLDAAMAPFQKDAEPP